jgi:hypothetical protein
LISFNFFQVFLQIVKLLIKHLHHLYKFILLVVLVSFRFICASCAPEMCTSKLILLFGLVKCVKLYC